MSAQRLRDHRVHPDTLQYWNDLLQEARRQSRTFAADRLPFLQGLIETLEAEIAERSRL